MAPLDSLPGDQRAVLQLVLGRGRSYDEIARLLSINPTAVRQRAHAALDALGPQTKVDDEHRAMVADYLLGQLPESDVAEVRGRLADSPGERAWARVLSSELSPLANHPLPEIPAAGAREAPAPPDHGPEPDVEPAAPAETPDPAAVDTETATGGRERSRRRRRRGGAADAAAAAGAAAAGAAEAAAPDADAGPEPSRAPADAAAEKTAVPADAGPPAPGDGATETAPRGIPAAEGAASSGGGGTTAAGAAAGTAGGGPRSSRLGGALLIGAAVVVVAIVLFIVLGSGGSKKHPTASTPAASSTAASSTASGSATSTTSTAAKVIAQINLTPTTAGSKAAGIAEVLQEGTANGIAIVAQNVPPNSKSPPNAYAVWLYNSPTDAHILGFVNPSVGSNGRLSTAGALPSNAAHYKDLIVTVETSANPKTPGQIILEGALKGV